MATALFIVIKSQGQWWVDFEGRPYGPYGSRELAAMEAKNQAQYKAHAERPAEVLVPDGDGKYWIIWNSTGANNGVPRSVSTPPARNVA